MIDDDHVKLMFGAYQPR